MHLLVPPQAVMSGVQDIVIAAGVEHMTSVPIGSNVADSFKAGHGEALCSAPQCRSSPPASLRLVPSAPSHSLRNGNIRFFVALVQLVSILGTSPRSATV